MTSKDLFRELQSHYRIWNFSGWIIKKLGDIHTMSLVLLLLALPFFCYSILVRPWWVLPVELISGFGFSITYVVTASCCNVIALPGTEATVQALFSAIFEGLGMYLVNSMLCSVFRLFHFITWPFIPERFIYQSVVSICRCSMCRRDRWNNLPST